ncbi:MAG: T9SS type A sorting domain-containing protein [Bacteroidales bacterium]|jgi:hypothetical protein|nr:T9SS type A sorting domain-containing protein [Bacteroidales bacterium]MDD4580924.1 T9SS type A sorting domain-containing protein [Bacteroidales bacterium]
MKRKISLFCLLIVSLTSQNTLLSQTETTSKTTIYINKAKNISEPSGTITTSPLKINDASFEEADLQWNYTHPFQTNQIKTKKNNYTHKRILKPGDAIIFEVENNQILEDSSHFELLSSDIQNAISRVPIWLHYDLTFKFKLITQTDFRNKMIDLLNATPKQYLDEVAFMLTYLPYEVLRHSRFYNDWDYLLKNVEYIYSFADSLKYVRLVEKGDTNTNHWQTTTEYKIKTGTNTFIWREIDPYYYYQFIVMPKLEQEGLYVADDVSSVGQRTWGYSWREYLWFDPDTNYSYRPVNIASYKVIDDKGNKDSIRIDTIPRLGEIMQMPEYLWDQQMTIYFFNRDFDSTHDAMNVLGNWCSRCIPMDVTNANDYRPSQPNHIAWKHIGNCHEDALLVAAATRTCLIPLMHIGDFCDDHVWGMFHDGGDSIWHHYEFFRGGCSPGRPYYWGMTNMQEYGHYGWNSSLVQGYIPDGRLMNVSDCYSKNKPASNLDLTIVDSLGNPIDGVRVNLYSTNTQYGTAYVRSAGYLWTDSQGKINTPIGTGKKYYMKIYHPNYGSYPTETDKVYILVNTNTVAGQNYNITFTLPDKPKSRSRVNTNFNTYDAEKSLQFSFSAKNISTDRNPVDGQGSTFYERTASDALLNIHVLSEEEMNTFKSSKTAKVNSIYTLYRRLPGELAVPIHQSGKTYIAVTNDFNYKNFIEIEYSTDIINGAVFDASINEAEDENKLTVNIYPNPADNQLNIMASPYNIQSIRIMDITGKVIRDIQNVSQNNPYQIDISNIESGIYFITLYSHKGKSVKKFIKK